MTWEKGHVFNGGSIMRKKSHISLAKYMIENLNDEGLKKHRFAFCLGSILPDIKPSFVYKRHEIKGTFPAISRHIARLSEGQKAIKKKKRKYYMDLGQISHYLADYFTFPHNEVYTGSLKEHCAYEKRLMDDLKEYIRGAERRVIPSVPEGFGSAEALCSFIQKTHEDYLTRKHDVEDDIRHIVEVNQKALDGMLTLLARRKAECHAQV